MSSWGVVRKWLSHHHSGHKGRNNGCLLPTREWALADLPRITKGIPELQRPGRAPAQRLVLICSQCFLKVPTNSGEPKSYPVPWDLSGWHRGPDRGPTCGLGLVHIYSTKRRDKAHMSTGQGSSLGLEGEKSYLSTGISRPLVLRLWAGFIQVIMRKGGFWVWKRAWAKGKVEQMGEQGEVWLDIHSVIP